MQLLCPTRRQLATQERFDFPWLRIDGLILRANPGVASFYVPRIGSLSKWSTLLTDSAKIELCFSKRVFQTGKGAFSRRNHALAAGSEKRSFFRTKVFRQTKHSLARSLAGVVFEERRENRETLESAIP